MLADRIKKIKFGGNNALPVFFICIVIATVFWVLNSLNKEYNHPFSFPVEIVNMPYSKRMVNTVPDKVNALFKARGFELFWFSIRNGGKKISIDLKEKNTSTADKISLGLQNEIINTFKNDLQQIEILSTQPDSIHLFLSARYLKKVPVVVNLKYTFKNRFGISSKIETKPDSILISGDKNDIAAVSYIETEEKELAPLHATEKVALELRKPENVFLSVNKIMVTIPVEEFTEGKISLPVNVQMLNGKKITVLPKTVTLTYKTTLAHYSKVYTDSFLLTAEPVMVGETNKLKLSVIKSPMQATVTSVVPSLIDYYFEK